MRCIGAWNPPCFRCSKSGKNCVVMGSNFGKQQTRSSRTAQQERRYTQQLPGSSQIHGTPNDRGSQQADKLKSTYSKRIFELASPTESTSGLPTERQHPQSRPDSPTDSIHLDNAPTLNLPSVYSTTPLAAVEAMTKRTDAVVVPDSRPENTSFCGLNSAVDIGPNVNDPHAVLKEHIIELVQL
jgi:hypothetical protein